jgi:DNA-binding transcriptional MerR regulator
LGFSVEDIRELLALSTRPDKPCGNIDKIAARHLASVDQRIAQLTALRAVRRACSTNAKAAVLRNVA